MSEIDDDTVSDLGDDAANAFLEDLTGEKIPGREDTSATEEDNSEAGKDAFEETEEAAEETAEGPEDSKEADPDDAEVDLKVGEEVTKAKLRDLKAAFLKATETDARHQAVSQKLAAVEAAEARATTALEKAVSKAKARWEPYSKLDFLTLSRDPSIDQPTFEALRKEANEALQDYKFFTEELDGQVKTRATETQAAKGAEAQATVAALTNPDTGIKGWDQKLYGQILEYAAKDLKAPSGAPQAITAEWALRALHKAWLYDQGQKTTATKLAKVVARPARTMASGSGTQQSSTGTAATTKAAMARLRSSGNVDDAADAFFASFRADD